MPQDNNKFIKYCVHCGVRVYHGQVYCPNCGQLVLRLKPKKETTQPKQRYPPPIKKVISRKCSGCGSIINSTVLEQCPICNTVLEKVFDKQITLQGKSDQSSFVFTEKKLEPVKKYVINKDTWNLKEGFSVFFNSIMIYFIIELIIYMIVFSQVDPDTTIEINIITIIISQLPGALFGIYAVGYIIANNHESKKLGFTSNINKILLAVLIGALGGFILVFINIFSNLLNLFFSDIGLPILNIEEYVRDQNSAIVNADLIWIILLSVILCVSAVSSEIVFRGVFHNTLKQHFKDNFTGKLTVILLVAIVYAVISLLLSLLVGILFFIMNFMIAVFTGILYEVMKNIYAPIVAQCFYNVLLLIIILYF